MKTPSLLGLEIKELLKRAAKAGIARKEIYDSSAPSHWPKDRCYRLETDEEFAGRLCLIFTD